jgi:hypothetical protein
LTIAGQALSRAGNTFIPLSPYIPLSGNPPFAHEMQKNGTGCAA